MSANRLPPTDEQAIPHNQKSKKTLVFILGTLIALGPLSIDMYLPSFKDISQKFNVSLSWVELSLASFFVGISLGQLFYGTLTDRYGRKNPLYLGLIIYAASSVACVFSPSVEWLIVFRFFQAIGACAGMVVSRAMVRDLFDHTQSARVFSHLMLVMGVAPIMAPLVGGYISIAFGWRAIFIFLTSFSLLCLLMVRYQLPETKQPDLSIKLQNTLKTYWSILCDRQFVGYALSSGFGSAGLFAYITGSPSVIMDYFGVSAQNYGWIFSTNALGLITASQLNSVLLRRYHPDQLLLFCYSGLALLGAVLAFGGLMAWGMMPILVVLFFFLSFLGIINPNSTAGALAGQGKTAGAASALVGTLQFLAAALASTAVSSWHTGTAVPMTMVMGIASVSSLAIYRFLVKRTQ